MPDRTSREFEGWKPLKVLTLKGKINLTLSREFENNTRCPHGGNFDTCIECTEILLRIAERRKLNLVPRCEMHSGECSKAMVVRQYRIEAGLGTAKMCLCIFHQKLLQQRNPHWKFFPEGVLQ